MGSLVALLIIGALVIVPHVIVIGRFGLGGLVMAYLIFGPILWHFTTWDGAWGWLGSSFIIIGLTAVGSLFAPLGAVGGTVVAGIVGFLLGGWMAK